MQLFQAVTDESRIPVTYDGSIYGISESATIRATVMGMGLAKYVLVFAAKEVPLTNEESSQVVAMFDRVRVSSQVYGIKLVQEVSIQFASQMCQPPVWSISFKQAPAH